MRYSGDIIEEVRSRNDIVDVIGQYVSLQKKGANYFGLCPFHSEHSPSFCVSDSRQTYHCFGCGEGGSVFSFLMKYENLSFTEAVKMLAERAGMTLPDEDDSAEARQERDKREQLLAVNKEAAIFFYRKLRDEAGKRGAAYFRERGLSDETMHRFGLGYAPMDGELVRYLREKGYSDALILEAGLAVHDEQRGMRDKFWNRVIFPIQDARGRVIGFGGRVMGDGKPKYLNSPETPVFSKRNNLFGLNFAKNARAGYFILCEGNMDVIAMHQAGFTMAVASLGTAFTEEQARILKRYTDVVLLAYDSDEAGTKAALKAIQILGDAGIRGRVIDLRPKKDPDEFITAFGADAFEQRIRDAENPLMFRVRVRADSTDMADPEARTGLYRYMAEILVQIPDNLERDAYTEALAVKYSISAADLKQLIVNTASGNGYRPLTRPKSGMHSRQKNDDNELSSQRVLLTLLADMPQLFGTVKNWVGIDDFESGIYRETASYIWSRLEEGLPLNIASMIDGIEDEDRRMRTAAILNEKLPEQDKSDWERAVREILYKVRASGNERRLREIPPDDPEYLTRPIEDKNRLEALRSADLKLRGRRPV